MKAGLIQRGRKRSTLHFKGFPSLLPSLHLSILQRGMGAVQTCFTLSTPSSHPGRRPTMSRSGTAGERGACSDNKLPSFRGLHPRTQLQLLLLAPLRGINAFLLHSRAKFPAPSSAMRPSLARSKEEDSETFPAFRRISFSRKCRLVRPSDRPSQEPETVAAAAITTSSPSPPSPSR